MPSFTIRTINSVFFTQADMADFPSAEDALALGVRGAAMIAADEIRDGKAASVIEVLVEDAGGDQVLRSAVMLSVAPLAVGPVPEQAFPLRSGSDK